MVSRYEDVVAVSRNHELFSSERGSAVNADMPPEELMLFRQQLHPHGPAAPHQAAQAREPRLHAAHDRQRLEARIREHARDDRRQGRAKGECDFVTAVAAELPLLVIAELLGVPIEDRWKLFSWSNRLIGADDPEYGSPGRRAARGDGAVPVRGLARGAAPSGAGSEDIVSTLVHADVDGEKLGGLDFNMFFFLLVVAGNETTRNAISGGMQALCEFPAQRERLLRDRELLDTAVDEMRALGVAGHAVPPHRDRATPSSRGQTIRENDKVVMYYGSANRDEACSRTPAASTSARDPNPHLGFGIGVHFCLGASLARMEMRVMFEELLRRLPDLELAGPVARLRSNFINGIKAMPVRFTPEA